MKAKHVQFYFLSLICNLSIANSTFGHNDWNKDKPVSENSVILNSSFSYSDLTITATLTPSGGNCGACDGAVDVEILTGQPPFTFNWSNGATSEDIQNLCLDLYEVTITDNSGCTFVADVQVGSPDVLDVVLASQAEVDDFAQNFVSCTAIINDLVIGTSSGNPPSDITDISGLDVLTSIGGSLFIVQNPNLSSLVGLQNITEIGASLHLDSNNALTSLSGLGNISELGSHLIIENHTDLLLLDGLDDLTTVGADVFISNNSNLLDLSALGQLQSVGEDLDIRAEPQLVNFTGLEQLSSVGGDLIIRDNLVLTDITALDHPVTIGGNLTIENTGLSNCDIFPVCVLLQSTAIATISSNANGCNSIAEVNEACMGPDLTYIWFPAFISCSGACDGTLTIGADGGTAPYTYEWSTGQTGNSISNLCPGEYFVTISDAIGLMTETSYQLFDPFPMAVTIVETTTDCFGNCNGTVAISVTGGQEPYSFTGIGTGNALCAGEYNITITDNQGCSVLDAFFIEGTNPIGITVDQITNDPLENGEGSIAITVNGGSAPLTYSWILDGVEVSTLEDPVGLFPGNYTLFIMDALGCSISFGPYEVATSTNSIDPNQNHLSLSPNPANDYLYIYFNNTIDATATYSLCSSNGQQVNSGSLSQNAATEIKVQDLPVGIYFLRLLTNGETIVRKILVAH